MWFHQGRRLEYTTSQYQVSVRSRTLKGPRCRTPGLTCLLIDNLQLPFNVSWQQIKDYVRQVCEVDHVEIFQKSTTGWVRVKGRENFDAAFGTMTSSFPMSHVRSLYINVHDLALFFFCDG